MSIESIRNYHMSRRKFLAGTGGAAMVATGGFPYLGAQQAFAASLSEQELRTVGLSVTVQERILNDFKEKSGVKAVSGKADIFPNTQTELLSGSTAYDNWETIGERLPAVIATDKITAIPTSAMKNWGNIRDTFTKPSDKWEKRAQIVGQIWKDEAQTELWMVPTVYNYDSIGYRPDLVSAEEASTWTAIFDSKFKGKTGLNVDPLIAFGQAVMAMNSLGLLNVPNPGNPDKAAIDEASKFLIAKKKDGQFRALWGDFGELVNLLASGEMVLCRRLATCCYGCEGTRQSLHLCRSKGRLSCLVHRQFGHYRNAEHGCRDRLLRLLALWATGNRCFRAGLLFPDYQHQGRHAS